MASTADKERALVVTGDVTMDWNLARIHRGEGSGAAWTADDVTEGYAHPGGAALLADLLEAVVAELGPRRHIAVRRPQPSIPCLPNDAHFHHSFVAWAPFPHEPGSDDGKTAWRVQEFLGLDRPGGEPKAHAGWPAKVGLPAPELVVLDDANLGFRDRPELWRGLLRPSAGPSWVLLKMARPIARGPLWEHLLRHWAERLVVVMTVDDLRRTAVQISRELSWERTAEDLVREFVHNPYVNALSHCKHVIVSLNTDGAVLLSKRPTPGRPGGGQTEPECSLFFDPHTIEGGWAKGYEGSMVGYTTCLTAAIGRELLRSPEQPDLARGIERGLGAMRTLHREGYGSRANEATAADELGRAQLAFPVEEVAGELARADAGDFAVASVPSHLSGSWTILQDRYPGGLEEIARRIAVEGPDKTLEGVPISKFGHLVTVDRSESEGFRSIRALIAEYRRGSPTTPLSIAVFGPPGAGKSFGVKQVAQSLRGEGHEAEIKELSFNLSQLSDASELYSAFHQARDECLAGHLPLVFWDEFDTKLAGVDFGWLRHFLVPMQDGTFQEGEIVHSLGPAIFVFAGGTSECVEDFAANTSEAFVLAKGPDFVSRLKGYVDVIGPNPRRDDPAGDPYYLIRRALLLRSVLERNRPALFDDGRRLRIDPAVLRAFLRTREYRHGARSLESVVAMSLLEGKTQFERSAIPAAAQLELHVDAADFLELATRPWPEEELLEQLAEAAHVVYCRGMLDEGYAWHGSDDYLRHHPLLRRFAGGAPRPRKTHKTLVAYEQLDEGLKEQNRDQVRDIPRKLDAVGYVLREARTGVSATHELELLPEDLERLAEEEHERWLWTKLRAGWRYGRKRSDERRAHPAIRPWSPLSDQERSARYGSFAQQVGPGELSADEKEKDVVAVCGIPKIAAAAGYEIVRVREPAVVIGVTGHRAVSDRRRLNADVEKALRRIERQFPGQPLEVISSLAEGADLGVVRRVLAHPGARLVAVLPLSREEYVATFELGGSKKEFESLLGQADEVIELEPTPGPRTPYKAVDEYIVDHSDVLITVSEGGEVNDRNGHGG
jgi:hypothetical protein